MVELARRLRMRFQAVGVAALLAAVAVAACGGSHPGPGSNSATGSTTPTRGAPAATHRGSLTVTPVHPRTSSELTVSFTAPAASGVHGRDEIGYSLSLMGPDRPGCVGAHEAGVPSVARGARGRVTLGPTELREPWCAGRYSARLLELSRAHCTGSAPCPHYVRVVGLVGRATFTIRRG